MAHRVCLKNLWTSVTKRDLLGALMAYGLQNLREEDVFIYRSGPMSRCPLCTAFVTLPTAEAVQNAVQLLQGQPFHGLSRGPIKAEEATPRMSTFKKLSGEPSGTLALMDYTPVVRQNLAQPRTGGQTALQHWINVKQEEENYRRAATTSEDGLALPVQLPESAVEIPPTDHVPEPLGEAPWKRRKRLRGETD